MARTSTIGDLLIGSWSLVSWTRRTPGGQEDYPFGEDAVGFLLYTGDGYMAAQLMRRLRTDDPSGIPRTSARDEPPASALEYFSYCGPYSVQEAASTVTHHVEASTLADWVGRDQVRSLRHFGNLLTLVAPNADGSTHTLTWKHN